MSRYQSSKKRIAEDCIVLDIRWFRKNGFLALGEHNAQAPWRSASGSAACQIRFSTTLWEPEGGISGRLQISVLQPQPSYGDTYIPIAATTCFRGETKYWFLCPIRSCRKRVGRIYLPPGETVFACRTCHNLTYRSCQEHDKRVDALVKNPEAIDQVIKHSKSWRALILSMKAEQKMLMTDKLWKI